MTLPKTSKSIPRHACLIGSGRSLLPEFKFADDEDEDDTAEDGEGAEDGDDADDEKIEGDRFRFAPVVSGQPVQHWLFGQLWLDLDGVQMGDERLPVMHNHMDDKRVGFTDSAKVVEGVGLVLEGQFIKSEAAASVLEDARAGFPWQSSIHAAPNRIEEVQEGAVAECNGETVRGPATIFRDWTAREASFVALGADRHARAAALSADTDDTIEVELMTTTKKKPAGDTTAPATPVQLSADTVRDEHPTIAAELEGAGLARGEDRERKRVVAILKAADGEQLESVIAMIEEGASLADATAKLNADLRKRLAEARDAKFSSDDSLSPDGANTQNGTTNTALPVGDDDAMKARWAKSAELRDEFPSFEVWLAYERAKGEGRIRRQAPKGGDN